MLRTVRYLLKPTRSQEAKLLRCLDLTRELYNAALEERKGAWAKQRISVSRYDQQAQIPAVRDVCPEFCGAPVEVLRGALHRLDKAFAEFYRRCKIGGVAPGYPRFKSAMRWRTIEFDNPLKESPIVAGGKRIKVPFLGKVKLKFHRKLVGRPRVMRIMREATGRWFVSIVCDSVLYPSLAPTGRDVGIDLGINTFVVTSDSDAAANLRPFKKAQDDIARAQQRVSRRKCGSRRHKYASLTLAKKYAHVSAVRREYCIKIAREIVSIYDCVYVEKLDICAMLERRQNTRAQERGVARAIHDAAWGVFIYWLRVKAESAGREVIDVDPRGTSQTCSSCGEIVPKGLEVRVHRCPYCGLVIDRDVNAALNILKLGRSLRKAGSPIGRRRTAKSESHTGNTVAA